MRNLKYLLAAAAIGGLVSLPQTSLAAESKADDYSSYGGYYPDYGYDPGHRYQRYSNRRYYRRHYDDDYYSGYYPNYGYDPYRRYHRGLSIGGPFIGVPFISFGFGGGWDD